MKYLRVIIPLFLILFLSYCSVQGENSEGEDNAGEGGNNTGLITLEEPIIINHNCTDISKIPDEWIEKVKEVIKVHYCHTSHGEQITVGLERLMNGNSSTPGVAGSKYNFYPDNCNMPDTTSYLSMMEGQLTGGYCETYITPELYWDSEEAVELTRNMLKKYSVNVSGFMWCTQLDYFSSGRVEEYLNRMNQLEKEFPNIIFIYMTGNAQSEEKNRYNRNNQIRDYCKKNNKVLFDFADLDSWCNGKQYTRSGIPMEHPQFQGDDAGHASYKSCDNKAKAFWWMMARLCGWKPE